MKENKDKVKSERAEKDREKKDKTETINAIKNLISCELKEQK